jgi:hypothetical protein
MKNFVLPYLLTKHSFISVSSKKFATFFKKTSVLRVALILVILLCFKQNFAQSYYRSKTSGNWNSTATWESSTNGASWNNASTTPNYSNAYSITIQEGHTVTITADVTIDQVMVAAGGQLTLDNGVDLTIANGSNTDFDVYGIFRNGTGTSNSAGGTVHQNSGSTVVFENGSIYQHGFTNTSGSIPVATWATGSTCEIDGYTSFSGKVDNGFDQDFYNFTWNCPNQTNHSDINLNGDLTTINGNFNMVSTGSGSLQLGDKTNFSTTISGNYNQSDGTLYIVKSSHTGTVNLLGDFNMSGGTLKRGGGTNNFNFAGTGTQKMVKTGGSISGTVKFYVNSDATLDFGNYVLDGSGPTFTVNAGGTVITANADGFTKNGSSGSVQVSGAITFSDGANFIYNGIQSQNVGDALTQNTPANITIENTGTPGNNIVSLKSNTTISGNLTISNGVLSAEDHDRDFTLSGNWINNGGSYAGGNGTVTFSGSNQTIGGTTVTAFPNLDIDRGANVNLTKSVTAASLTLDAANASTSLTQNTGIDLTISGDVTVKQPSTNNVITAWNINEGTATVDGSITIGGTNNNATRVAKIVTTTGTLTILGDLTFNSSAGNSQSAVVDISGGAGMINLAGNLVTNHNSGTLIAGNGATFNFNGTNAQSIPVGVSDIVFNNIYLNNTSADGATLGGSITSDNVTGDIRIKKGKLNTGGYLITGNSGKTFEVADGATFRLTGTSSLPNGFSHDIFGTNSITDFAGTDQTISSGTYGILKTSGTGTKVLGGAVTVDGDVTISDGTSLDVSSNNFGISVKGNWTNNGTFNPQSGTVILEGTDAQTIGGTSTSGFKNLTINNSAGVTLLQNESVSGVLTLSNGLLNTSESDLLTLNAGSSISGAGEGKFINGPMKKIGNTPFTFPVGKSSVYAPVGISAPASNSDAFTAEYMRANAKLLGPITASGLVFVSACEYWKVERANGNATVDVTLSWSGSSPCSASSYVTSPSQLVVAHFNGTSWNAYGNDGGYTGNVSNGTVTWKNVSAFSPFTFGSNSPGANPLPVKFDYAKAAIKNDHAVQLDWRVLTESNLKDYEIERSKDGQNFESIGQVLPTANNSSAASYSWMDMTYDNSVVFYRIKSVDINNDFLYSTIMKIDPAQSGGTQFVLYPNPVVGNQVSIQVNNINPGIYTIQVFDNNGRNLYSQNFDHHGGTFSQMIQLPADMMNGIYSMRIHGTNLNLLKSFIVK